MGANACEHELPVLPCMSNKLKFFEIRFIPPSEENYAGEIDHQTSDTPVQTHE